MNMEDQCLTTWLEVGAFRLPAKIILNVTVRDEDVALTGGLPVFPAFEVVANAKRVDSISERVQDVVRGPLTAEVAAVNEFPVLVAGGAARKVEYPSVICIVPSFALKVVAIEAVPTVELVVVGNGIVRGIGASWRPVRVLSKERQIIV